MQQVRQLSARIWRLGIVDSDVIPTLDCPKTIHLLEIGFAISLLKATEALAQVCLPEDAVNKLPDDRKRNSAQRRLLHGSLVIWTQRDAPVGSSNQFTRESSFIFRTMFLLRDTL
jgi:hypothetical protein